MDTSSDLSILAERMVISFVTSSPGAGVEAQAVARSMGARSLRLGLLAESAESQLLILAEDSKRFYRPQSTLAGAAASTRSFMESVRHARPSEYEDVEVAYQQSGCQQLTAVPIITDSHHVLGVLLLGMPTACTLPEQHLRTLAQLAAATAPALQRFMLSATAMQDTSLFLARATAECLYGRSAGGAAAASEASGSEDAEWLDFDVTPYLADDDVSKAHEGALELEPCESLESMCSEADGFAGVRARLLSSTV